MHWADEMIFWRTGGRAADGWSKSTWPDWSEAFKSVKGPSGGTLSHMERPFREGWALRTTLTAMFLLLESRYDVYCSHYKKLCIYWRVSLMNTISDILGSKRGLHAAYKSGAACCIRRNCWLRADQACRRSHAWAGYTCCVLKWHICVRHNSICVPIFTSRLSCTLVGRIQL